MPLTGDFMNIRQFENSLRDLARTGGGSQREIGFQVIKQVRGVLKEEFASGEGPESEWQRTVRGQKALISKKLPQDFFGVIIPGGVFIGSRVPWLQAHQEGFTFPERQVAKETHYLTFNKKGRLIKKSRTLNKKGEVKRGVYQTFAKAHTVGGRELPARPIYPEGAIPEKWAKAINEGAEIAMTKWYERAAGK
jgi:hypothetical protein